MRKDDESSATAAIVARFRSGDDEATRQIHSRVKRIISFHGWGIPLESRRDLEQSVLIQLWQVAERPGLDPSRFWGLVEVISSRRCIDWLRRQREEQGVDEIGELAGPDPGSLAKLLGRERRIIARRILAQMPEPCRELLRLRVREGKTYRQIAALLGESEGALRVRMYRCIQRARGLLEGAAAEPARQGEASGGKVAPL